MDVRVSLVIEDKNLYFRINPLISLAFKEIFSFSDGLMKEKMLPREGGTGVASLEW